MTLALLFPGQGSQQVGMGEDLAREVPEARAVFDEADEILGFSLSSLMWGGPEHELTQTRNAQPALLVHSTAVWRSVRGRIGPVAMAAGHSLGEFSAHVASDTLSFADALRAVRRRGELMFESGEARPGTMAAVLGMDDDEVAAVCARVSGEAAGVCVPANLNSAGQVVISGDVTTVEKCSAALSEAGAKRVVPLNVSGAFHSPLMETAETGLREFLESVDFSDPAFPVYANVTAEAVTTGETARELLVSQLISPVRWAASVQAMVDAGADRFLELGSGSVLCGLNRRNARGLPCDSVGTSEQVRGLEDHDEAGEGS